jgi:hypothetical protein
VCRLRWDALIKSIVRDVFEILHKSGRSGDQEEVGHSVERKTWVPYAEE